MTPECYWGEVNIVTGIHPRFWKFMLLVPVPEWQEVESVLTGSCSNQTALSPEFLPHKRFWSKPWERYGKWPQLLLCSLTAQVAHLSLCPFEVMNWQLSRWITTLFQTHRKTKFVTNQQILWTHDEAPSSISSRQVQAWAAPLSWKGNQALAEQLCLFDLLIWETCLSFSLSPPLFPLQKLVVLFIPIVFVCLFMSGLRIQVL